METKVVKRKKLNIARTLVFILIIYIIVCAGIFIYKEPIRHIEIVGNNLLSDAEIIRTASLKDYPPFVSVNRKKIEKKIKKNPLILNAQVSFSWNFTIKIKITDNSPLFIQKLADKVILSDGSSYENDNSFIGLPLLLNEAPEKIIKNLAKSLKDVDKGILYMISEIEYAPSYNEDNNPIDEERFLLTMTDNNFIYITAKKAKLLNKYLDIAASTFNSGRGTLYLDSPNDNYIFSPAKEKGDEPNA